MDASEFELAEIGKAPRLALLILTVVLLSVLGATIVTTLILGVFGNWQTHRFGLTLTLKIMWGGWLVLLAGTLLTWVTIIGWRFRKAIRGRGPIALLRSVAAGVEPPAWAKTGWTSF